MDRRLFLKTSLTGVALATVPSVNAAPKAENNMPKMKAVPKQDAFRLGMAGYTFVKPWM